MYSGGFGGSGPGGTRTRITPLLTKDKRELARRHLRDEQIRERQASRYSYQEQPRSQEDYKRIVARQRSEMLTMQNDQQIVTNNSKLTQRIYATLQKVNLGLRRANLSYEWFVMKNIYDDGYYY